MMQQLKVAVFTQSDELFNAFCKIFSRGFGEVHRVSSDDSAAPAGTVLAFVDGKWEGGVQSLLDTLSAQAVYTVLVDDEKHIGDGVPELLSRGQVDDLLLTPLRPIEVLGKLKHVAHLEKVREMASVNSGLKSLIEKFEEDLRTARGIQRSLIPEKFEKVAGLKVNHRYLSGLKSGGDYLDFFEFEDKTHVGMLMSDSTGYGLSSAFMSVILKLAVKLSKDGFHSPSETVAKIFEELALTMKPKENFSIFYGILNRKTFELTYTSCGSIRLVHQNENRFEEHAPTADALVKGQGCKLSDRKLALNPSDRLVVFSDGFGEPLAEEGRKGVERVFVKSYGDDAVALINELIFRVKAKFEAPDDMPEQDCSVMIIDIEKRAMRLAR